MVITAGTIKFKKKQRVMKLRKALILGVKASIVGAIALFVWGLYTYILTSPYFYINKIEISGLKQLDRDSFDDFINIPPDTNIFTVSVDEIRKKAESHPWVKNAAVSRQLPDIIEIRIEEYEPVAMIEYDRGLYYVDSEGKVFKKIEGNEKIDFPLISITQKNKMDKDSFEKGVIECVKFLNRFFQLDKKLYSDISELNFDGNGLLNVFLSELKMQIVFHPDNIENELRHFVELLKWSEEKSIIPVYVYFITRDRAVTKFRKIINTTAYNFKSLKYAVEKDKKEGDTNG
jgi:cell division protein FtsQ